MGIACLSVGILYGGGAAADRLEEAHEVFMEIMDAPDKGIPQDLLGKAECVVMVPGLKKGAFIIGGKYGRGFILCRAASFAGWSAPAGVIVEGGSFGFQIGGSESDVIMLVMNERGAVRSDFDGLYAICDRHERAHARRADRDTRQQL